MRWSDDDATFLLDSDDRPTTVRFHGHAFIGSDLVVGEGGVRLRNDGEAADVGPGLDGAYAILRPAGGGEWEIGSDYKGFSCLYYHRGDDYWAVSNSFMALYRHLRQQGVCLSLNRGSLEAWAANHNIVRTLMTFDTGIEEIKLAPSHSVIRLRWDPARLELRALETDLGDGTYRDDLSAVIETWHARLAGILLDANAFPRVHVTGGRDSRTVLAAVHACKRVSPGVYESPRLSFFSNRAKSEDYEVATQLSQAFGFKLGVQSAETTSELSGAAAAAAWEEAFVGGYAHLVLPQRVFDPRRVVIPGVGGEAHRQAYRNRFYRADLEGIAEILRPGFASEGGFEQWRESFRAADELLQQRDDAHPVPMMRSHREFRDRFHTGKDTVWTTAAIMLASRYMVAASNRLRPRRFESAQILYDLMSNLSPRTLMLSFDQADKSPSGRNVACISKVHWSRPEPGQVFVVAAEHPDAPAHDDTGETPLHHILTRSRDVLKKREAVAIGGRDYLRNGIAVLEANADAERQSLHEHGRPAHLCYLLNQLID